MQNSVINVYAVKKTARLLYTLHELLERRVGLKFKLITDADEFNAIGGFKLNYSKEQFDQIPQIHPAALLFEKRIQHQDLNAECDDYFRIFTQKNVPLGFDPFAAAFFFLSRYEVYLPHRKDEHGRFPDKACCHVQANCYAKPWVDTYAVALRELIVKRYPDIQFKESAFKHIVTIDVDQVFALKSKGLARTTFSVLRDLMRGAFMPRLLVMLNKRPDPNDIYEDLIRQCDDAGVELIFFVQVGDNSRFDINNPPHLMAIREQINKLALGAHVGLHPSYFSIDKLETVQREHERLKSIISDSVTKSRQHYLRYEFPKTFAMLNEIGITDDFTLGFNYLNGFLAGTAKPFRFFDLDRDEVSNLTFQPMAFMDVNATRTFINDEKVFRDLDQLTQAAKEVGGTFISTWHPEVLTGRYSSVASQKWLSYLLKNA